MQKVRTSDEEVVVISSDKILWIDIETTGKAKAYDQVVQVAYAWENEDGELVGQENILVRPSVPISQGAFETHGISDDMVANSPTFDQVAQELGDRINEADMIATYNGNRFDIPILDAEFKRAGMPIDLSSKLPLDGLRLLQEMKPRDLSTMYEKYVGEKFEGAHDALADIRATQALYRKMKSAFGLQETPDRQVAESLKGLNITVDGKLTWDKWNPDVIILSFGKYAGRPIEWVIENDPGYLSWIINADKQKFDFITVELVEIARRALDGADSFYRWVGQTYGKPPDDLNDPLRKEESTGHELSETEEEASEEIENTEFTDIRESNYLTENRGTELYNTRFAELERSIMSRQMAGSQALENEFQNRLQKRHQDLDREFQNRLQKRHQDLDSEFQSRMHQIQQEIDTRLWSEEIDSEMAQDEIVKSTMEGSTWLKEKEVEATTEENAWLANKLAELAAELEYLMQEGLEKIREEIIDRYGEIF